MDEIVKMHYRGWTDEQVECVKHDILPAGKNYSQCYYFCKRYLHKGFKPVKSLEPKENPRGAKFAKMHSEGMSYAAIAKDAGISRQRVAVLATTWIKNFAK